MTMVLLIFLIAVPLLEIAVMIKVGSWIGFWPAFGIVIGTFILGSAVIARSGLSAAFRVQEAMLRGEPPVAAMLDGALLAMAGILLATPGFVSDCIGLALLLPPLRELAAAWLATRAFGRVDVHVKSERFENMDRGSAADPELYRDDGAGGPVIDGEFERLDERPINGSDRRPDGER